MVRYVRNEGSQNQEKIMNKEVNECEMCECAPDGTPENEIFCAMNTKLLGHRDSKYVVRRVGYAWS
jgi:hypothetical protein